MFAVMLLTEKPLEVATTDGAAIRLGWELFGVGNAVPEPVDAAAAQGLLNTVGNVSTYLVLPAPETIVVQGAHRGGQVLTAAETSTTIRNCYGRT